MSYLSQIELRYLAYHSKIHVLYSVGGYLSLHIAGVAWGNEVFSNSKLLVKHYVQEKVT